MTIEKKIELIAERYGYEPQSRQCIEEMAELTQAINAVLDEMADTLIMLWQLKYLLGFGEGPLAKRIEEKLNRQLKRMGVAEE